jgi:hypothetical protein
MLDLRIDHWKAAEQQDPQRAMALCRTLINEP